LKKNKSVKCTTGFTLIEILVTIAIFSVIMLTLFSSLRIFLTSAQIIKKEVNQIEKTAASFRQIETDLKMIFITQPPIYSNPEFDSEPDLYRVEGQESELSFTSLCHVDYENRLMDSVVRIVYYLRPGKDQNRFDLCREQEIPPYSDMKKSCTDPILIPDISEIKISYVDHEGEVFDSWDSESQEFGYSSPSAINFAITFYNENGEEKENTIETSISLPVKREPLQ
jgi:general secretion pathway protein J